MENFRVSAQEGFNARTRNGGLINAVQAFELFVGGSVGGRVDIKNPVFSKAYTDDEIQSDVAKSEAFFKKYAQGSKAEFRPAMLAEELIKVGERFGLFGDNSKLIQASAIDDYERNADGIATIPNKFFDKKDEAILPSKVNFVIDVTTDSGDRLIEKIKNLSSELKNGKLSEVKYFPPRSGALRDVPRFIIEINEDEILSFFEKARSSLDRVGGMSERQFMEKYEEFSISVCEKVLSNARMQVGLIVEYARALNMPNSNADHTIELLKAPLDGFYQTLDYLSGINVNSMNIDNENDRRNIESYINMLKKILSVGVAVERVFMEKEKRATTQQMSVALH